MLVCSGSVGNKSSFCYCHIHFIILSHTTVNRVTHHNNLVIGESCCSTYVRYKLLFHLSQFNHLISCFFGRRCLHFHHQRCYRCEINEMILRVPILWWQPLYILLYCCILIGIKNADQYKKVIPKRHVLHNWICLVCWDCW